MKRMLLAVAVGLLVVANLSAADDKDDLKKLEGTWQMVSRVADGKETPADEAKKFTVVIDAAGNWKAEQDGKVLLMGSVKLVPGKDPKAADWSLTVEGKPQGKPALGIYAVDGDTFKHCYAPDTRPTKFESKEGTGVTYAVFKRVKK